MPLSGIGVSPTYRQSASIALHARATTATPTASTTAKQSGTAIANVHSSPVRLQDLPTEMIEHCVRHFQSGKEILPFFKSASPAMKMVIRHAYAVQNETRLQDEWNRFCIHGRREVSDFYLMLRNTRDANLRRHAHGMHDVRPASVIDINAQDKNGTTALIAAVIRLATATIALLLRQPDIDVNAGDTLGMTPLMHAIVLGHNRLVRLLLKAGSDIDARDNAGSTALILAAAVGNNIAIGLRLKRNSDVNIQNHQGCTALIYAVALNNVDAVRQLLKAGADLDSKDHTGYTALKNAMALGNNDVITLLDQRSPAAY
jgi:hypothetical protein